MDRIEAMRKWRVRPGPDLSIAGAAGQIARELARAQKTVAAGESALQQLLPPELRPIVLSVRLVRGVLLVRAADASAVYQIDRWLRAGGELALRKAAKNVRHVRLVH